MKFEEKEVVGQKQSAGVGMGVRSFRQALLEHVGQRSRTSPHFTLDECKWVRVEGDRAANTVNFSGYIGSAKYILDTICAVNSVGAPVIESSSEGPPHNMKWMVTIRAGELEQTAFSNTKNVAIAIASKLILDEICLISREVYEQPEHIKPYSKKKEAQGGCRECKVLARELKLRDMEIESLKVRAGSLEQDMVESEQHVSDILEELRSSRAEVVALKERLDSALRLFETGAQLANEIKKEMGSSKNGTGNRQGLALQLPIAQELWSYNNPYGSTTTCYYEQVRQVSQLCGPITSMNGFEIQPFRSGWIGWLVVSSAWEPSLITVLGQGVISSVAADNPPAFWNDFVLPSPVAYTTDMSISPVEYGYVSYVVGFGGPFCVRYTQPAPLTYYMSSDSSSSYEPPLVRLPGTFNEYGNGQPYVFVADMNVLLDPSKLPDVLDIYQGHKNIRYVTKAKALFAAIAEYTTELVDDGYVPLEDLNPETKVTIMPKVKATSTTQPTGSSPVGQGQSSTSAPKPRTRTGGGNQPQGLNIQQQQTTPLLDQRTRPAPAMTFKQRQAACFKDFPNLDALLDGVLTGRITYSKGRSLARFIGEKYNIPTDLMDWWAIFKDHNPDWDRYFTSLNIKRWAGFEVALDQMIESGFTIWTKNEVVDDRPNVIPVPIANACPTPVKVLKTEMAGVLLESLSTSSGEIDSCIVTPATVRIDELTVQSMSPYSLEGLPMSWNEAAEMASRYNDYIPPEQVSLLGDLVPPGWNETGNVTIDSLKIDDRHVEGEVLENLHRIESGSSKNGTEHKQGMASFPETGENPVYSAIQDGNLLLDRYGGINDSRIGSDSLADKAVQAGAELLFGDNNYIGPGKTGGHTEPLVSKYPEPIDPGPGYVYDAANQRWLTYDQAPPGVRPVEKIFGDKPVTSKADATMAYSKPALSEHDRAAREHDASLSGRTLYDSVAYTDGRVPSDEVGFRPVGDSALNNVFLMGLDNIYHYLRPQSWERPGKADHSYDKKEGEAWKPGTIDDHFRYGWLILAVITIVLISDAQQFMGSFNPYGNGQTTTLLSKTLLTEVAQLVAEWLKGFSLFQVDSDTQRSMWAQARVPMTVPDNSRSFCGLPLSWAGYSPSYGQLIARVDNAAIPPAWANSAAPVDVVSYLTYLTVGGMAKSFKVTSYAKIMLETLRDNTNIRATTFATNYVQEFFQAANFGIICKLAGRNGAGNAVPLARLLCYHASFSEEAGPVWPYDFLMTTRFYVRGPPNWGVGDVWPLSTGHIAGALPPNSVQGMILHPLAYTNVQRGQIILNPASAAFMGKGSGPSDTNSVAFIPWYPEVTIWPGYIQFMYALMWMEYPFMEVSQNLTLAAGFNTPVSKGTAQVRFSGPASRILFVTTFVGAPVAINFNFSADGAFVGVAVGVANDWGNNGVALDLTPAFDYWRANPNLMTTQRVREATNYIISFMSQKFLLTMQELKSAFVIMNEVFGRRYPQGSIGFVPDGAGLPVLDTHLVFSDLPANIPALANGLNVQIAAAVPVFDFDAPVANRQRFYNFRGQSSLWQPCYSLAECRQGYTAAFIGSPYNIEVMGRVWGLIEIDGDPLPWNQAVDNSFTYATLRITERLMIVGDQFARKTTMPASYFYNQSSGAQPGDLSLGFQRNQNTVWTSIAEHRNTVHLLLGSTAMLMNSSRAAWPIRFPATAWHHSFSWRRPETVPAFHLQIRGWAKGKDLKYYFCINPNTVERMNFTAVGLVAGPKAVLPPAKFKEFLDNYGYNALDALPPSPVLMYGDYASGSVVEISLRLCFQFWSSTPGVVFDLAQRAFCIGVMTHRQRMDLGMQFDKVFTFFSDQATYGWSNPTALACAIPGLNMIDGMPQLPGVVTTNFGALALKNIQSAITELGGDVSGIQNEGSKVQVTVAEEGRPKGMDPLIDEGQPEPSKAEEK